MSIPAEWGVHKATWLAWPDLPECWLENHEGARKEFLDLCKVISLGGNRPTEKLKIFVKTASERSKVAQYLPHAEFHFFDYGDIWLRDTGCVFYKDSSQLKAHVFRFNGWGEKYKLGRDAELSAQMARIAGAIPTTHNMVFEGGAVDHNGQGAWITTAECLLNPNRNPNLQRADYDRALQALGAQSVGWLSLGLLNDHTDGHVDNIVRFVNERTLLCMESCGDLDPHKERIDQILSETRAWADKNSLDVLTLKSPGEIIGPEGDFLPASYMNFYIANNSVAVPTYGSPQDAAAVEKLQGLFRDRKVVGLASNNILTGGGSFHCITQQEPL